MVRLISRTEVDVCPVMGACIYVATKVEELPIHIKTIVGETRSVLGGALPFAILKPARQLVPRTDYGLTYPSDQAKTAEMEFCELLTLPRYLSSADATLIDLLEDLECHLVVFHPYRSLLQLTGRDGREAARAAEALDLDETTLQNAWYALASQLASCLPDEMRTGISSTTPTAPISPSSTLLTSSP